MLCVKGTREEWESKVKCSLWSPKFGTTLLCVSACIGCWCGISISVFIKILMNPVYIKYDKPKAFIFHVWNSNGENQMGWFQLQSLIVFCNVAYCCRIGYNKRKTTQVVFKKPFLLYVQKKSNLKPFKWCIYCCTICGIVLLRVASNPISGQLFPFHLIQNDLMEWAIILCKVTYSSLAFKMVFIYCILFFFDEMSIVYHWVDK